MIHQCYYRAVEHKQSQSHFPPQLPKMPLLFFTLIPLLLFLSLPLLTSPMSMDPYEKETLFQVMDSISSDRIWRSSNPEPCSSSWPGLECKRLGGGDNLLHVTRLDFGTPPNPNCKTTATFPSHLFHLPHLQSLFLFDCFRTTNTTLSIPTLKNPPPPLQQLSLRSNPALVGPIPPQLSSFTSLQVLTLSQTRLSGKIPDPISLLTSLVHLDLSYNSLAGRIPNRITRLKNLANLDLSYNSLSGPIPSSMGQMTSLQKLDLSSNSLTGIVPGSFTNLSLLTFLALSSNRLIGHFPAPLSGLQNLQYFLMDDNPMSVRLPSRLGELAKLQELRLANSGYWGPIPGSFASLANLTTLSLENNRLTGAIPPGLSGLGRMYHLNLSKNMLAGVVPFGAGFVRRLGRNLDLSGNSGLCVDDADDGVMVVGVEVCGGNGNVGSSKHQITGRSGGVGTSLCCSLSTTTLLLGGLGVLASFLI